MRNSQRIRLFIGILLLAAVVAALLVAALHPEGRQLLRHPHSMAQPVRSFAADHPFVAEGALFAAYAACSMLLLPVWWLNILAGVAYGLFGGTARCAIAAAVAAALTARLAHWLAPHFAEHSHGHVLPMLRRYASEGGLLAVLLVRLTHLVPFGLSNYAFGLLGVSMLETAAGTLVGNIPSIALYVLLGSGRAWRSHPYFVATIGVLTIAGLLTGAWLYRRHHAAMKARGQA